MKKLLVLVILLLSCDGSVVVFKTPESDCDIPKIPDHASSDWVCWNPRSDLHGKPCTDECMVPGDQRTFCYWNADGSPPSVEQDSEL
jgi:hypothetical protein